MDQVLTTCIYCGCGCGLYLVVEDGRLVGVKPSLEHPVSRGKLCVKGWHSWEFVGHPDRLTYPQIRSGQSFSRASWDKVLDLISGKLQSYAAIDLDSTGILTSAKGTNEENFLWMKLCRAALKTNNVDHVARLCHAPSLVGLSYALGCGAMTNPISDLSKSDCILAAGSNLTEQHTLVVPFIRQARSRGAKLIVVDPRNTHIARQAHLHLSPRPGTDIAWINALLNLIIQEELIDRQFISQRTDGFEAVRRCVSNYTAERSQKITGIPASDLREAALAFGSADRASIVYAMGITQHHTGTDNVQALANLALATGNLGKEGSGIYPLRGHQNVQGACDMGALPTVYSGYQPVSRPEVRQKFERAWKTVLPEKRGQTALEMLAAASAGKLKALIIVGENPVVSFPDAGRVRRALEALEFLVVCDIFPTETTELADVILPAACWAEKDGTFTSTERRVQRIRKALPPPGEARPEWEVAAELMLRMGVSASYSSPEEVMDEIRALTPIYGGMAYSRLGDLGILWPCHTLDHPGTEILHIRDFSIGKARFRPVEHREPLETASRDYPLILTTGRSGHRFHTDTMIRRSSLPECALPGPAVEINSEDALRMGIEDGERVLVETSRAGIEIQARITPDLPPGLIFIPFHFQQAPANALTSQAADPLSGIPELKVSAARVRKLE